MAIKQATVGLWFSVALVLTAAPSLAQTEEGKAAEGAAAEAPTPAEDTAPTGDATAVAGEEAGDADAGSLEELCRIDPENCVKVDMKAAADRVLAPDMYAVQQIWALRKGRFEINPYGSVTMNDQFVAHPGPGVGLNYYVLNWLAGGVNGNFYQELNAESDFNFETSRAARVGQPITEYQWNVNANVTLVPAYGKFAVLSNFIFHYDFYFLAGAGAMSTRPKAVVDPDNRTFDWSVKPTWGFGGGIRIFFTRYLSAMLEIRDYMFLEDLENPSIASGIDSRGLPLAQDPSTWLAPDKSFTNNVQAQLGLSVFLPFSWKYELAK